MIEPRPHPVIVYVSIGNSDDKLTQAEWSSFIARVRNMAAAYPKAFRQDSIAWAVAETEFI